MISICIPAYKYVKLVDEAVNSILVQDEDFELIVLDDFDLIDSAEAQTSLILETRERFAIDKRVKWHKNSNSLPIQDNWNKTVSLASRPYIKLMGADDRLLPGCIHEMQKMIVKHPSAAMHGHLAHIIDEDGKVVRIQEKYNKRDLAIPVSPGTALKGKLRQEVRFKEPVCNFYKKTAWESVGGYDKKYRFLADIYFNTRMMKSYQTVLWNLHLSELRRHRASDGATLAAQLALDELRVFVDEIIADLGRDATLFDIAAGRGWVIYRLMELLIQRLSGHPSEAGELLERNFGLCMSNPMAYFYVLRLLRNRLFYGDVQQTTS